MICFLFGCAFGMAFHNWLLQEPQANRVGKCGRTSVDVSGYFAGVDLNVSPEELALEPVTLPITGRYGGWPFETITEDTTN